MTECNVIKAEMNRKCQQKRSIYLLIFKAVALPVRVNPKLPHEPWDGF